MPEGLDELLRQRALLLERLKSLDRQIAALEAAAESPADRAPPMMGGIPADDALAHNILEKYRQAALSDATQAKRGCLLYFAAAVALLFLCLGALYLYVKAHRGP